MQGDCKFVMPKSTDKRRISVARLKRLIPHYMVPSIKDHPDFQRGYLAALDELYKVLDKKK